MHRSPRIAVTWKILLLSWTLAASGLWAESLPPIAINQNHISSGILRDGVLTIQLEVAKGEWHPEADDGIALAVYAFGESGHPLQNPGPLIRVPVGTEIHASLHNKLPVAITVHGLGSSGGSSAVDVGPGATEQVQFKATTPGLYFYWGASRTDDLKLRYGVDSELTGALIVDPQGQTTDDEIFVIEMMSEHPGPNARQTLATINGKSWPYTQRFRHNVGQHIHWRWINATNEPHALHLHGFYYRIDAINRGGEITEYDGDSRPMVVTQRIAQGDTFDMSWSPDRPGQWLFHCHMFQHMIPAIVPSVPELATTGLGNMGSHARMQDGNGMGQLVLGITVAENTGSATAAAWHPNRKLQLKISD